MEKPSGNNSENLIPPVIYFELMNSKSPLLDLRITDQTEFQTDVKQTENEISLNAKTNILKVVDNRNSSTSVLPDLEPLLPEEYASKIKQPEICEASSLRSEIRSNQFEYSKLDSNPQSTASDLPDLVPVDKPSYPVVENVPYLHGSSFSICLN